MVGVGNCEQVAGLGLVILGNGRGVSRGTNFHNVGTLQLFFFQWRSVGVLVVLGVVVILSFEEDFKLEVVQELVPLILFGNLHINTLN